MKPATSQPIRIQTRNQRDGGFGESKSSGNLVKLSQSLGTLAPGRLSRHMSNVSDIYHAGYLLKRSNKPLGRPLPVEDEECCQQATAPTSSSPPSTYLRHRVEVDVFNASDLDLSCTSSNSQLSPNLPQHKVVALTDYDPNLEEFAQTFLGIDRSIGLFPRPTHVDALPRNDASSPPMALSPPLRSSEPMQIPTPDSYYTKRDSFRQTRRSSEPSLYNNTGSPGSLSLNNGHISPSNGTPTDVLEQDQHVWRAKYCVLENGLLYFYRHQVDAESAEARSERQQLLHGLQQQQSNINCIGPVEASAATMREDSWRPSLAMSPMHRSDLAFLNTSNHNGEATTPIYPTICEKYVALNTVGTVRSAELEHGQHSFVLASEDEDPLILRAPSNEDMNEWLFQFHRSIASYVMGIMESCSSAWDRTGSNKGGRIGQRSDLSPELAMTLSPRVQKSILSSSVSTAVPFPLSHGHGRTQLYRKRTSSTSSSVRLAKSFQDEESPLLQRFPPIPYQQNQAAWTPPRAPRQMATPRPANEASPEFSAPQSDYPETERPPPTRPGKYVPPHLRRKTALPSTECISLQVREQSPNGYVPQHPETTSSSTYVPPFRRNKALAGYIAPQQQTDRASLESTIDLMEEQEEDQNSTENVMFEETAVEEILSFSGVKLGGCADPSLVKGSVLDSMYISRKASKLGKVPTVPFGCISSDGGLGCPRLRFEIGAVSECGIRDSNEDSYFIASDFLDASRHAGVDVSKTVWGVDESGHSPGLFAVFDGHCGDHAARFAAERLMTYVQVHSVLETSGENSTADRIKDVLLKAIRQLDDEFCNVCVSEGRDWESGATALIAALIDEQLVIANLGDARGVMCRSVTDATGMVEDGWTELPSSDYGSASGRVFWKQVTSTHTPSRADEKARIESANGWITHEKEIPVGQLQRMVLFDQDVVDILKRCFAGRLQSPQKAAAPQRILQISRVCGELAVSRAIGDRDFKSAHNQAGNPSRPLDAALDHEWHNSSLFLPYPEHHSRSFIGDLVSNIPDFESIRVGEPHVSDEFLLLCCDGLWDVMDSDDAVRVTRDLLFEKGWSAKQAASRLAELAVHLGSSDNITVIVIRFQGRSDNKSIP